MHHVRHLWFLTHDGHLVSEIWSLPAWPWPAAPRDPHRIQSARRRMQLNRALGRARSTRADWEASAKVDIQMCTSIAFRFFGILCEHFLVTILPAFYSRRIKRGAISITTEQYSISPSHKALSLYVFYRLVSSLRFVDSRLSTSSLTDIPNPRLTITMKAAILSSLVAAFLSVGMIPAAFAANTYVGETSSTSCMGSAISSYGLTPGQAKCYPQKGASVWLSTDGYACTLQLFSAPDCQGTSYAQIADTDDADTCLDDQGTGGSFQVTCEN